MRVQIIVAADRSKQVRGIAVEVVDDFEVVAQHVNSDVVLWLDLPKKLADALKSVALRGPTRVQRIEQQNGRTGRGTVIGWAVRVGVRAGQRSDGRGPVVVDGGAGGRPRRLRRSKKEPAPRLPGRFR